MKFYIAPLVFTLLVSNAYAADITPAPKESLFFTNDETGAIQTYVAQMKSEETTADGIHLGAVLYYNPEEWTIWLQNQRWTPETSRPDLQVVAVAANEVHLKYLRDAHSRAQDITLRPYQTYLSGSGEIIEGRH